MATNDECTVEGLNLFERPLVQTAIKSSEYVEVKPISALGGSNTIKVYYQSRPGVTIDLSRTLIKFDAKITKADGTPIAAKGSAAAAQPSVAVINNIVGSAFQEVDLELNSRNVCASNNNYAHRAYLETITSYNVGAKKTWLKASGYTMNTKPPVPRLKAGAEDEGFTALKKLYQESNSVTVAGPLHVDLCNQHRHLIPNVNVLLTFILNPSKTVIQCASDDTEKYLFKIIDMSVYFMLNTLSDAESLRIESQLLKTPALYPITRVDVRTFNIAKGMTSYSEDNAFVGQLPTRIIFALTSDLEYSGSYETSPFNYDSMKLNYISLMVGGKQVPALPMHPSEDEYAANDEYLWLMAGLGKLYENDDIGLTPDEWRTKGNCIFAFHIKGHDPPDCVSPMEQGNVRINLRFKEALGNTTTLIVLAEFSNTIIIDHNRAVVYDF
jgi:hypothetical protein